MYMPLMPDYPDATTDQIFDMVIKAGFLSNDPDTKNYAKKFMYMGNENTLACFKHIDTRGYLKVSSFLLVG